MEKNYSRMKKKLNEKYNGCTQFYAIAYNSRNVSSASVFLVVSLSIPYQKCMAERKKMCYEVWHVKCGLCRYHDTAN